MCEAAAELESEVKTKTKKYKKEALEIGQMADDEEVIKMNQNEYLAFAPEIKSAILRYTSIKGKPELEDVLKGMRPYVLKGCTVKKMRSFLSTYFDNFTETSEEYDEQMGESIQKTSTVYKDMKFKAFDELGQPVGKSFPLDTKTTLIDVILKIMLGEDPYHFETIYKRSK